MFKGEAIRNKHLGGPILIAWIVLLLVLVTTTAQARDRQAARRTFDEAVRDEESLKAASPDQQTFSRYRNIIQAYRKVLDLDPTYGACDDSLYRAAALCREAGQRFQSEEYLKRAVHYLTWLRREYPYSPLRDDALLMLGDIQAVDLADRSAARKAYEEFLSRYKKSDRVDEVVRKLNDLDKSPPPSPTPVPPAVIGDLAAGLSARLTDIRFWSTSDYTRVVMDLDREVEFIQKEIHHPYRIYFDFQHTILSNEVKNRDFSIGDTFLHRIRVGQNRTDIARVVLDFKTKGSFSVFPLYNPFRVVIDIKDADKGKTLRERKEKLARIFSGRSESGTPPAKEPTPPPRRNPPDRTETATLPPAGEKDDSRPLRPSGPTATGEHTLPRILGMKVGKIVIDPGHGGKDSGSIGHRGLKEKDLVLSIARQLKQEIEERLNVEVILTRNDDVYLPLEQRTAIANMAGADLFISLHANADQNNRVAGIETFYLGLTRDKRSQLLASIENAASQQSLAKLESSIKKITMYEKMNESRDFASKVHGEFFKTLHKLHPSTKDRGVKKAPFVVLIGTDIPSILLEIGYISHQREAQIISSPENQKKLAVALCRGIEKYLVNLGTIAWDTRSEGSAKDQGHGQ
ncbi:MAG: N-acetylmuramoyl-L-alanine amidase [Acidobacteria bacterium]|nr:N-acetylmuramoyl-L-alanine amidase [Acidobacteriota bacterium]